MIYSDRVILITNKPQQDFLGTKTVEDRSNLKPCMVTQLSLNKQSQLFGKADYSSYSIHVQGKYPDVVAIELNGVKRTVKSKKIIKNRTVLYV